MKGFHIKTEADVVAYMARQGMVLTPALTLAPLPVETSEGVFLTHIRKLAKQLSFLCYHTHNSEQSDKGFPDLVLVRAKSASSRGRLIFAELKDRRRKATPEQLVWLDVLRHSIAEVEAYHWKPSDWPHVVEILTRKEQP